jgi:hypothetical protein
MRRRKQERKRTPEEEREERLARERALEREEGRIARAAERRVMRGWRRKKNEITMHFGKLSALTRQRPYAGVDGPGPQVYGRNSKVLARRGRRGR